MKNLCGLACLLVSMLLGGGLVTPLPSEAYPPSLTISVNAGTLGSTTNETIDFDATTGNTVANGVACAPADATNYNLCFKLKTFEENGRLYGPPQRQYKIMNAIGTNNVVQDARLLISDGGAGKMFLSSFRLVPAATTWDSTKITVTITYRNFFNNQVSLPTDGSSSFYRVGLSITGVFKLSPSPTNDTMHMSATGIFCTSTKSIGNPPVPECPSGSTGSKTIDVDGGGGNSANKDRTTCAVADSPRCKVWLYNSGPQVQDVRFDSAQISTFPGYRCNNGLTPTPTFNPLTNTSGTFNGKACTPDITATIKFELFGSDIVNADGSPRMTGGVCGVPKAPSCDCGGKKPCIDDIISGVVDNAVTDEKQVEFGFPDSIPCDPNTVCSGIINNTINVGGNPSTLLSFPFTAIGPDVNPFEVNTATNTAAPFTNAFTGQGGRDRVLAPDYNNPNWPAPTCSKPPCFYAVDQIHVTDLIGNAVGPPFIETFNCPGGSKGPLIIHDLEGTYNVQWHLHIQQQPGALCQ